jgi:hypothetical protein
MAVAKTCYVRPTHHDERQVARATPDAQARVAQPARAVARRARQGLWVSRHPAHGSDGAPTSRRGTSETPKRGSKGCSGELDWNRDWCVRRCAGTGGGRFAHASRGWKRSTSLRVGFGLFEAQRTGGAKAHLLGDALDWRAVHVHPRTGLRAEHRGEPSSAHAGVGAELRSPNHGEAVLRVSVWGLAHETSVHLSALAREEAVADRASWLTPVCSRRRPRVRSARAAETWYVGRASAGVVRCVQRSNLRNVGTLETDDAWCY